MDEFFAVVRRGLPRRRLRQQEARVVTARPACLGDPVAEVVQAISGQSQLMCAQQIDQRQLALRQAPACGGERFGVRAVDVDQIAVAAVGEQQPGFLEAFADRGDPVSQAATRDAKPFARRIVVQAVGERGDIRGVVGLVDRTAGKHIHAGGEFGRLRAPRHQHLHAVCSVANQDQRGRGARRNRSGAHAGLFVVGGASGWRASPSRS